MTGTVEDLLRPDLRAVFIDVGGPIYDDHNFVRAVLAALDEISEEQGRGPVDRTRFRQVYDAVRAAQGGSLRGTLAEELLGDRGLRGELHERTRAHWVHPRGTMYDDVRPFLEAVHGRLVVAIVANQERAVVDALHRDGLADLIDVWGVSAVVGHEKPSPEFFGWALREAGVAPGETVHIGNRLDTDVRPARDLGLATVWVLRGEAPDDPTPEQLAEPDLVVEGLTGLEHRLLPPRGGLVTVVIGLDLATADARAVAVSEAGDVLAERSAPLPPVTGSDASEREQDADYLAVSEGLLTAIAADLGPRAQEVAALCVTGTSGTMVPCDRFGRPQGRAMLYDDRQAHRHAAALQAAGLSGSATSPMARIGLLVERGAELVLHTPDVVHAGLLGQVVAADTSHALKAGIDPVACTWDERALEAVGVPRRALPDLVHPGTLLGGLTGAAAERTGLPAGTAVVAGMTDGCTAQIATGAVAPGESVGVLGTTLVLKAVAEQRVEALGGALYSHLAPDGRWWAGGASNVGARPVGEELGGTTPQALADLEGRATAYGAARTLSYPLRGVGERFPFSAPEATGFVVGQEPAGSDGETERYRALLEGVALVERLALETLVRHGVGVRRHHLAGGAARNALWCRLRATVLELPVVRARRTSSAFGAALLALAQVSGTPLAEVVARVVEDRSEPVEPLEPERDRLLSRLEQLRTELHARGLLPDDHATDLSAAVHQEVP